MANIKNIQVGSTPYDIEALHFVTGSLDTPAQWKQYIDDLVNKGIQIVIDDPATSGQEPKTTASASTMGKLYMVQFASQTESGTYTEFITIDKGTGTPRYVWEKIGTTAADLSEYAKKGTYSTTSAGATTTSEEAAYAAAVSGTVKYDKANANTGNASGGTVDFTKATFTGTTATLTLSKSYTPAGTISKPGVNLGGASTITYVSGVKSTDGTANALTGVAADGTASVLTAAIKGVSLSASDTSTDGPAYISAVTGTFNTGAIKSASLDVKTAATTGYQAVVTAQGTLSGGSATGTFNTDAIKSATLTGTKTFNTDAYKASVDGTTLKLVAAGTGTVGISTTAASTASVSYTAPSLGAATTKYIAVTTSAAGTASVSPTTKYMKVSTTAADAKATVLTGVKANGTATVVLSTGLSTATFNNYTSASLAATPTFTGTAATLEFSTEYQPEGTISGSQALGNHSHSISTTSTNATVSLSAAISAHTHTIGNHTHSVTI